jgi:hypothetical protein
LANIFKTDLNAMNLTGLEWFWNTNWLIFEIYLLIFIIFSSPQKPAKKNLQESPISRKRPNNAPKQNATFPVGMLLLRSA